MVKKRTKVMETETVGAVAAVSVAAVQVQMVRVGAKLVPLANVPFANRDEWHPAYMCVKGWLQARSRWHPAELADAANALAECQPEGHTAAATRRTPSRSRGGHWQ